MIHFQSRAHLILWLENNCARKAIVRALYEGQVEFFGGFDPIPPTTHPGWIMRVTSAHGRIWYVAVICYDRRYGIRILRDVPWGRWRGSTAKNRTVLMNGDNPTEYWGLRRIWNEQNTK
ncbi:hypothetical protein KAR91_68595 [Candidatus Pacearchaeota archaeon]|nr:hypothetical protein [Candidatus Pacearchaeota archaeon]